MLFFTYFSVRLVLHYQISENDVYYALTCIKVNQQLIYSSFTLQADDFLYDIDLKLFPQQAVQQILTDGTVE